MKVIVQKGGRGKKWICHNYTEINNKNIQVFTKTGIENSSEIRYKCTCCGGPTCIDDSVSNSGADLICGYCAYKYYGGWANAHFSHCHTLTWDPRL